MNDDFGTDSFWETSDSAQSEYVDEPLTAATIQAVEQGLGYQLPRSYVKLMASQNGGTPTRTYHRAAGPTSWAKDHIAVAGIFAIGTKKRLSLLGECGSRFWIDEWGYPAIGIYFADCPSAGHDMLCLDYGECGSHGEPKVVHVDQELDYRITLVARDFETFIRGLQSEDEFGDGVSS